MSRWVRLNIDWHTSDWLVVLSAESRLAWVQLICHVKAHGFAGRCKAIMPQVAERMWFVNEPSVRQMLQAAENAGALSVEDGEWVVSKWRDFQGDDSGADRQRRFRERQKGARSEKVRAKDVFARDGNACLKCGATENLVVDHIVPLAGGGEGVIDNLQTLCRTCNSKKSDFVTGALRYGNEVTLYEDEDEDEDVDDKKSKQKKNFTEPTAEDVIQYASERGKISSPSQVARKFHDYHSARGWVVGKARMKDWRAAWRLWESNQIEWGNTEPKSRSQAGVAR